MLACRSRRRRFSERKGAPLFDSRLPDDQVLPEGSQYATAHKTRQEGRVVQVETRVVFGTTVAVLAALALSPVSRVVNAVYVGRHNGTDRNRNGRKAREGYAFSGDWAVHGAVAYSSV